jgi:hypothetical protein
VLITPNKGDHSHEHSSLTCEFGYDAGSVLCCPILSGLSHIAGGEHGSISNLQRQRLLIRI